MRTTKFLILLAVLQVAIATNTVQPTEPNSVQFELCPGFSGKSIQLHSLLIHPYPLVRGIFSHFEYKGTSNSEFNLRGVRFDYRIKNRVIHSTKTEKRLNFRKHSHFDFWHAYAIPMLLPPETYQIQVYFEDTNGKDLECLQLTRRL